ncbi:MAG: M1 family metallopeptidase [Flavobacteriales bacterium]|jgi:hypothetical protein|nr:M1 family metallopeptidase [Flavobacteriales bacterium]
MKKIALALVAFGMSVSSFAQNKPYFQQDVKFKIDVKLDDERNMLYGNEELIYTNNSPVALNEIYMHIWPNAYKNRNTALAKQLARTRNFVLFTTLAENKGYIDSLDFKVNGVKASWEYDGANIDICKLLLASPLQPGQSITITTPFRVKIPSGSISRLGHIGQSFQITQWYPKPAVYDRNGWHQMPYLTQGEFYSEFGSYDVSITLPKNYILGATGDCQTPSEVEFMNEQASLGMEKVAKATIDGNSMSADLNEFPASSKEWKTVRYTQSRVHDFGWFADKRWIVLKGNVETPANKNQVTTWALFTPESAKLWSKSSEYLHDAIYYYSLWNGDYPYNQVTAVDGTISAGGGMEYPNVTVIGSAGNDRMLETVIMHEVGHNWFYGILGSNERDNAWMDEGLNSFNEDRYMDTKYPDASLGAAIGIGGLDKTLGLSEFSQRSLSELSYLISASQNLDQPLQCHSDNFTELNYGGIVYKKTALLFYYLKGYLGETLFDQCMHNYFEKWKFKHPQPEDIQSVFEETTNQKLDWFFNELIKTTEKIDFSITRIKQNTVEPGNSKVKVKNSGYAAGAVSIGTEGSKTPIWTKEAIAPGKSIWITAPSSSVYTIDPEGVIPEVNRENNTMRSSGLFKKVEPVKIKFFSSIDNPKQTELFYLPMYAYNVHDGSMIGVNLHNKQILRKNFEWNVSPLYSFKRKAVNGFASVAYHKLNFTAGTQVQRFGMDDYSTDVSDSYDNYMLFKPYLAYTFRNRPSNFNKGTVINVALAYQFQWMRNTTMNDFNDESLVKDESREFIQFDANWSQKIGPRQTLNVNGRVLQQASYVRDASTQIGTLLSAGGTYRFKYSLTKDRDVYVKAFAGYQVDNNALYALQNGAFGLSGVSGAYDYTFDNLYFGRGASSGFASSQVTNGMGNLGVNLRNAGATKRLLSTTVGIQLPIEKFNISLQGTILDAWSPACPNFNAEGIYWNTSAVLQIIPNVWSVTLPIYGNEKVQDAMLPGYFNGVMMNIDLIGLEPFKLIRSIAGK